MKLKKLLTNLNISHFKLICDADLTLKKSKLHITKNLNVTFQALQESAGLDRLVRQTKLVAHLESMLFSSLLTCAPRQILAVLRWGALLTVSHMRTLTIRPNDPRETRVIRHDFVILLYRFLCEPAIVIPL